MTWDELCEWLELTEQQKAEIERKNGGKIGRIPSFDKHRKMSLQEIIKMIVAGK